MSSWWGIFVEKNNPEDGVLGKLLFIFKTYYKARQCVIGIHDSSAYCNLRQRVITICDSLVYYNYRQLLLQFTTDITIHGIITIRLRHVGPAVVPRFETCGKRVKKQRVHPTLTAAVIFFCFINERFVGKCSFSFLRTELVSLFGADSLSRSVHCAPWWEWQTF